MNPRYSASIIIILLTLFLPLSSWAKAPPRVVASIPPVYALVAEITKGVTEPSLLVHGNTSPHHYTLTPRDASVLSQADIVFYIGDGMENFLQKPLRIMGKHAIKVPLAKAKDVVLLPAREHTLWAGQHDDEEEHHHHGHYNMHIWLDPNNAKAMLRAIARQLEEYDPEHKKIYAKNVSDAIRRLEHFDQRIKQQLAPYKHTPFIVFHDAYPYFERHYGLHSTGALMLSPEVPLGASTLNAITKAVRKHHVKCLFSEPNYDPKRMEVIASHTGARLGILDPLETSATVTEEGYGALLEQLAKSLVACLGKE